MPSPVLLKTVTMVPTATRGLPLGANVLTVPSPSVVALSNTSCLPCAVFVYIKPLPASSAVNPTTKSPASFVTMTRVAVTASAHTVSKRPSFSPVAAIVTTATIATAIIVSATVRRLLRFSS